jgi:hypothetical protein
MDDPKDFRANGVRLLRPGPSAQRDEAAQGTRRQGQGVPEVVPLTHGAGRFEEAGIKVPILPNFQILIYYLYLLLIIFVTCTFYIFVTFNQNSLVGQIILSQFCEESLQIFVRIW